MKLGICVVDVFVVCFEMFWIFIWTHRIHIRLTLWWFKLLRCLWYDLLGCVVVPDQVMLLPVYQIISTLLRWSKMSTHWIGLERAEVYQGAFSVELLFIALLCVRWILKWLSEWSIQMRLKIIERFWCLWNIGFIHLLFSYVFWFGVQIHLLLVDLLYDVPLLNLGHFSIWIFIWIFWCHIIFELLILYFWCA